MGPSPGLPGLQDIGVPDVLLHSLGALADHRDPPRIRPSVDRRALQQSLASQRCWALGAVALDRSGAIDEAFQAEMQELAGLELARTLRLDQVLLEVVARLEGAGIAVAATKGAAFARHLWATDLGRSYSDVDIVVPRHQLVAAATVLETLGGNRHHADPRDPVIQRWGKSVAYTEEGGSEIDLHVGLCEGPYAYRLAATDLFCATDTTLIAGRRIPTLVRPWLFLHACYHSVLPRDRRRLVPLVDVAMGMRHPDLAADDVIDLAERCGAAGLVAVAVEAATALLGLERRPGLQRWSRFQQISGRERRWLRSYNPEDGAQLLRITLYNLEAQRSWRDRRDYLTVVLGGKGTRPLTRARAVLRKMR